MKQMYKSVSPKDLFPDFSLSYSLDKPRFCPYCKDAIDAKRLHSFLDSGWYIAVLQCTACDKSFLSVYRPNTNGRIELHSVVPDIESNINRFEDLFIESCSPRFIDLYNQALLAENSGCQDLAAMGFRNALEVLVKDYAIKECGFSEGGVASVNLFKAIGDYLQKPDLVKPADVIRIFGNDYTHYKEKYPDKDYNLLKEYMKIFVSLIRTELMIKHPPVERE